MTILFGGVLLSAHELHISTNFAWLAVEDEVNLSLLVQGGQFASTPSVPTVSVNLATALKDTLDASVATTVAFAVVAACGDVKVR